MSVSLCQGLPENSLELCHFVLFTVILTYTLVIKGQLLPVC